MEKSYEFRIYPNRVQIVTIEKTFGCCRFVYNRDLNAAVNIAREGERLLANMKGTVGTREPGRLMPPETLAEWA